MNLEEPIAGPSKSSTNSPSLLSPQNVPSTPAPVPTADPMAYYVPSPVPQAGPSSVGNVSYYSSANNSWMNWNSTSYPYPTQSSSYSQTYPFTPPYQPQVSFKTDPKSAPKKKIPSPPPPPPLPLPTGWDAALKEFLSQLGLNQALRGLELDLLVMNPEWERAQVPKLLDTLINNVQTLRTSHRELPDWKPTEERKIEQVHSPETRSHSSITRSVSAFLAQSRLRNDSSNRAEFLESLAEKRARISVPDLDSTCARTDTKSQNRDVQMKYDIAKNEDGPLRRTTRRKRDIEDSAVTSPPTAKKNGKEKAKVSVDRVGLKERLSNIETHLSVRHVPYPPRDLLERVRSLEDHIIRLEKDYPPWAALHFNQPGRSWPPPPRPTPVAAATVGPLASTTVMYKEVKPALDPSLPNIAGFKMRHTSSSLHKAVLEKYEVHHAMTGR